MSRLYVIANGFDRYHGIPSDYRDFATYLRDTDQLTFRIAEEFLPVGGNGWDDFEQRLAEFDEDQAIDYAGQFHSDERHGDFQYELQQIAEALSTRLKAQFTDWVRGLHIPERAQINRPLFIDPNARFLSFNYTSTLGRLYGIPPERVLHIHGSIERASEELVLGHGWERGPGRQPQLRVRRARRRLAHPRWNLLHRRLVCGYIQTDRRPDRPQHRLL